MKRLLGSTAALSIALAPIQPWPLMAQTLTETGSVVAADGSVLCEPTAEAPCDPAAFVEQAAAIAAQMAEAEAAAAAAAAAEAEAKAAADAAAEAEAKAAADAAAAEAEAKAAADAAAAEAEAKAAADAAAVEAEAKAAADAAAVEAEAKAAADAAAVEAEAKAAADAAAVEAEAKAAADAAAVEADAKAAADAAAVEAEAKAAADAAAVEAEAKAVADAAAVEAEAKAAADATAVEAEAKAAADAAAVEAEAKAAADAAAVEAEAKAAADAAAAEAEAKAAADAAAAEAEAKAAADAAGEAEVKEEAPAEVVTEEAKEDAPADAAVNDAPADAVVEEVKTEETIAAEAEALKTAQEEIVISNDGAIIDPAAGLATAEEVVDPTLEPVAAPVVSEAETETLTDLLTAPNEAAPAELGAAAALVDTPANDGALVPVAEAPTSPDAVATVVETLTENDTRTSDQEFAAAPVVVAPGKKNRLSNLEKAGLLAIGALMVGAIIKDAKNKDAANDRQVVSNTGDRVVVLNPDGTYSVYKDDDAVLRRPGSTVRTETFKDGSTRTIVERQDGTQVVTIRDATGRVLRRSSYDARGREIVLIDDFVEETPVVIKKLPKPKADRITISAKDDDAALRAKLAAREAAKSGRTFSLRQIREIPEVRALAATIDAGNVTFDSGSAAISATEADALADLGSLMQDLLDVNPGEVFLIEGHTDATGKAAMNLALSDRRAESVALALTEYFDIPPENMIVQGYGEGELLIDTQADERRNRRVAARVITPLLRMAE